VSASTIKSALVEILSSVEGLKHVEPHYPRLSQEVMPIDYPRAVVWRRGNNEMRTAAGGNAPIGYKSARWRFTVHVMGLYVLPLEEVSAWDVLLDAIYDTLRLAPTLYGKADTATTKVMRAEEIAEEALQPDLGQMQHAYNTYITVTVEEWIKA